MFFYCESTGSQNGINNPFSEQSSPLVLTASALSLAFADTCIGTSSVQFFTISAGGLSSTSENITITDNTDQYHFSPSTFSMLGSGDPQLVTVTFEPSTWGLKTGTITVSSSGEVY